MPDNCPIGTDLELASRLIREGNLVSFATETVYGLGANALDASAVAKIFEAKQRPSFDPLIVHVASRNDITRLVVSVPEKVERLIEKFWPGPLTFVLPKSDIVPDIVTSGLPDVAVRCPAHPVAHELIKKAGCPIAAPSANLFGRISPTTAQHVAHQLGNRIDYILDGGQCEVGLESTVIGLNQTGNGFELLRPGGLAVELIEEFLSEPIPLTQNNVVEAAAPSPGLLKSHYAPRTKLTLIENLSEIQKPNKKAGLLTFERPSASLDFSIIEVLSDSENLVEAAAKFFAAMRRLDEAGVEVIYAKRLPQKGLGIAMNDRLSRAAHD